jgi:hypothetical protein
MDDNMLFSLCLQGLCANSVLQAPQTRSCQDDELWCVEVAAKP